MTPEAMRYAVIRARDFALQALRRDDPALAGRPVAIVCGEGQRAVVTEVAAEAAGVERGIPATLAFARCPHCHPLARSFRGSGGSAPPDRRRIQPRAPG